MRKIRRGSIFLGIFSMLCAAFPGMAVASYKILNVPVKVQEQTNWCWAGSSSAIFSYFSKDIKQCYIADNGRSTQTCCSAPAGCDQSISMFLSNPSIKTVLRHWCFSSAGVASYLSYADVREQIDAMHPFIIRYQWTAGGGGHFIVLRGYNTKGQKVYLMDPGAGKGYGIFTYASVKGDANHNWTHTLKDIRRVSTKGTWTITNTDPVKSGSNWNLTMSVNETAGGCGKVTKFTLDFYDQTGKYISTQTQQGADFPGWYKDCDDPDVQLASQAKYCCNTLWVSLGGRPSGAVKYTFFMTRDKGTSVKVSKKIALPGAAAASGKMEVPAEYASPMAGF